MSNGYEHASQYQLFLCAYPYSKRVMPLACERYNVPCACVHLIPENPVEGHIFSIVVKNRLLLIKIYTSQSTDWKNAKVDHETVCHYWFLSNFTLVRLYWPLSENYWWVKSDQKQQFQYPSAYLINICRLSMSVWVDVVLNRNVIVDGFDNLCSSHLQSSTQLYHVSQW